MENETRDLAVPTNAPNEIMLSRDPKVVLAEAKQAAQALMSVVSQKKKPVIMNGEQYLEFEDWQTMGRFYGLTVRVTRTTFLDYGQVKGWEASADVVRLIDGVAISSADAMCLNDEDKWSTRTKYEYIDGVKTKTGEVPVPLFQLRSMAQTRACAKAFRNVLAWVVVMAGFKPTPAEEMTGSETQPAVNGKPPVDMPQAKQEAHQKETPRPANCISEPQTKRLYAIAKNKGYDEQDLKTYLAEEYGLESSREINRNDYENICLHFQTPKLKDE